MIPWHVNFQYNEVNKGLDHEFTIVSTMSCQRAKDHDFKAQFTL